ncbi:palmitoyl-CoA hydrolase [Flavobacterium sp. D11R37]|uniref:acyl-CoA thioester hydrolase/BAAT C-terminal domain-containing protein n=1 Tax=Flavobacterium coralii TaxID=2838017 RepID=UPI001CA796E6|nr:acyl-CoA thioester hydrolase/BAAT C-terminal domain-containing protein [Flavobacterium coralii]MBY8964007.1 palmitoyl-CoA hydrolase [Flavobacterium coralii]
MNKSLKIIIGSIAIVVVLIAGYLILDSILFDGVRPKPVNESEIKATLFAKKDITNQPAIILVGGGEWGDYWGQEFAKAGYVDLSLPYYRLESLPDLMEEIPLEYFEKAIHWLKRQPQVNPEKIVIMGASRNAELALLVGSYFPESINGVIAYNPTSVSWSNTVLPFNSDSLKPSWTFKNQPVPFIAMEKIKAPDSDTIETLTYWKKGLSDSSEVNKAIIPVERINSSILLLSGVDDEVWPSAMMSDMIARRIENSHFNFDFENVQYENAGHLISGNPNHTATMRQGKMEVDGKSYNFNYGGTEEGDIAAQKDASTRVFRYLSKLKND